MLHKITLSSECWHVLKRLGDSEKPGTLEARRIYPFEHRFFLSKKKGGDYAGSLAGVTIDTLFRHRLLTVAPVDPQADRIRYALTSLGADVAARGEFVYDDENLEIIEAAA